MGKRLLAILLAIIIAAGVGIAGFTYSGFVSETIYEESTPTLSKFSIRQIRRFIIWFR